MREYRPLRWHELQPNREESLLVSFILKESKLCSDGWRQARSSRVLGSSPGGRSLEKPQHPSDLLTYVRNIYRYSKSISVDRYYIASAQLLPGPARYDPEGLGVPPLVTDELSDVIRVGVNGKGGTVFRSLRLDDNDFRSVNQYTDDFE